MPENVDLSRWGPITWLIYTVTVIATITVALYLLIERPPLDDLAKLMFALAPFFGASGLAGLAQGRVVAAERLADASSGVVDVLSQALPPDVSNRRELSAVVRPDEATTPDGVEGSDTDPDARLRPSGGV